mgnify:CR=1 FL=1
MQSIFIRATTKRERANPTRALVSVPDRDGFDKVYKPYGPDGERAGAGFYYIPHTDHIPHTIRKGLL